MNSLTNDLLQASGTWWMLRQAFTTFLTGLLIAGAGRAVLEIACGRGEKSGISNAGFVCVPLGAAVTLLASSVLFATGHYSPRAVLAILAIITVLGVIVSPRYRSLLTLRQRQPSAFLLLYFGLAATIFMMAPSDNLPHLRSSSMYLTLGAGWLNDLGPTAFPQFGELLQVPFAYSAPTLGATFALFSNGNPLDYYAVGEYWITVFAAPLVLGGIFLLFRRFLPLWPALAAAFMFLMVVLAERSWSLRGETLGWIFGSAFLIVFADFLDDLDHRSSRARTIGLTIVLALLFPALSLTHGVVTAIACFVAIAMIALRLFQTAAKNRFSYLGWGAACGALG